MMMMFPKVVNLVFPAGPMQLTKLAFQHIMGVRDFVETNFQLAAMTDYVEVNKYGLFLHEAKCYRAAIAFFSRGIEVRYLTGDIRDRLSLCLTLSCYFSWLHMWEQCGTTVRLLTTTVTTATTQ
jgi:hypothetical protein